MRKQMEESAAAEGAVFGSAPGTPAMVVVCG